MEGLCLVWKNTFPVLINNDDLPEEGEGELWADILIFLCHPHASFNNWNREARYYYSNRAAMDQLEIKLRRMLPSAVCF